jgi:hypothetical protein
VERESFLMPKSVPNGLPSSSEVYRLTFRDDFENFELTVSRLRVSRLFDQGGIPWDPTLEEWSVRFESFWACC